MGRTGQFTFQDNFGRRVPQLRDHFDVRLTRNDFYNCKAHRLWYGHGSSHKATLPQGRDKGLIYDKAAWQTKQGYTGVFTEDERGSENQSAYAGIWFFYVVGRPSCEAFSQGNRDSFQYNQKQRNNLLLLQ